jgi:hypothetical protein
MPFFGWVLDYRDIGRERVREIIEGDRRQVTKPTSSYREIGLA